jgi:hypothetical protein
MTMTIDLPVDLMEKVRSEAAMWGIQLEVLLLEKIHEQSRREILAAG